MQCQLYFDLLPKQFPGDSAKVAFILSLLSGNAQHWAASLWTAKSPASALSIHDELWNLQQADQSIHEYTLHFRKLAASRS